MPELTETQRRAAEVVFYLQNCPVDPSGYHRVTHVNPFGSATDPKNYLYCTACSKLVGDL